MQQTSIQSSAAGAIVLHKEGGFTLRGDATLLPRAAMVKMGLERSLAGSKMLLTRTATPANLLRTATSITGKPYKMSTKGKMDAVQDLRVWIETMRASLPVEVQR